MRYEDLKLEGLDMPEELRDNLNGLFTLCQKYYTYYLQYKKIVEKENTLLKISEDYICKIVYNKHMHKVYNDIDDTLNEEAIFNIFEDYLSDDGKDNVDIIYDIVSEYFDDIYTINRQYKNLQTAMEALEEAFDITPPSIQDSVNAVLTEDTLNMIYESIENQNYALLLLVIAPVRRALYDGKYKSFCKSDKNRKNYYFNLACDFNYISFKNEEINKRIKKYKPMLDAYKKLKVCLYNL